MLPKQIELGNYYKYVLEGGQFENPSYKYWDIQKGILDWNIMRGNIDFNPDNELKMYLSEKNEANEAYDLLKLGEVYKFTGTSGMTEEDYNQAICEILDSLCDRYVVFIGTLAKSGYNNEELSEDLLALYSEYQTLDKEVKALGFDFIKCMTETLKEIGSRLQCPDQAERWEIEGREVGEKWLKHTTQPEDTLYKANYLNCRIK